MPSPTRRALFSLRNSFQFVEVTERWCNFSKRRKDLFKCIDIVAVGTNCIIGVQCTSAANHNARREKILRTPAMKAWIASGQSLWIMSYGKKKGRWEENIEMMKLGDFK